MELFCKLLSAHTAIGSPSIPNIHLHTHYATFHPHMWDRWKLRFVFICINVCILLTFVMVHLYEPIELFSFAYCCVSVCVRLDSRYSYTLSAISLCSRYDSTPAVSALETTGGWLGTDINNAINPCGYAPCSPLLMTTCPPPLTTVLWCTVWVHIFNTRYGACVCMCVCVERIYSLDSLKKSDDRSCRCCV